MIKSVRFRASTPLGRAYEMAQDAHSGQYRKDATPYILHIKEVLEILQNEFKIVDESLLVIAALHDVIEDSDKYSLDDIKREFGETIAHGVDLMTDRKEGHYDRFMKRIHDCQDPPNLIALKLADRLHSLRTMQYLTPEKIKRNCQETRDYILPYAKQQNLQLYKEMVERIEKLEKRLE